MIKLDDIVKVLSGPKDPKEWIEAMEYNKTGEILAVGSHDNGIYLYNTDADGSKYKLTKMMRKHSSYITALDWSLDS